MEKLYLRESDYGYKSGDRYYGGLPAEPEYTGPGKKARYWKELIQYFKDTVEEYPEYFIIGSSPVAITLRTPDGKETIDLTKFDALADADEAIEMASHYFDESLFEARKKKKNGALVNPDAGNVEHNIDMFNKMNSPVDGPSNNPISGPFGGDICGEGVAESLTEDNNVSSELPAPIDGFLQDVAQMFGTISYADIIKHKYTPEEIKQLASLRRKFRAEARYNDDEAEAKLQEIATEVATVVKNSSVEECLTEAMPKKETIDIEYSNLEFTQCGNQRDADDWDECDRCVDWTYEVDKDDLYTFIFESCIDETDFPEAFDDDFDPNNAGDWSKFESWLDDNFDAIYAKYEDKILENWEEDAAEQATQDYDPDDYVDWDSMPGGHDDDRYWEDLKEGEDVFMEKYSYGLTEEYKREPRITDYFEQMNSEEDEA